MIYKPTLTFERARNQHSLFLYQIYCSNFDEMYNTPANIMQTINHSLKMQVNNTQKILKSLDLIGINNKSIFTDFESIAIYIKNKYEKILEKERNKRLHISE